MRNRTFDLFKWVAALFVLLLHVPFPAMWVARCVCLPVGGAVFFMVSGYFTYGAVQREDAGRLVRRMRRLLRIFVPAADFTRFGVAFCLVTKPGGLF